MIPSSRAFFALVYTAAILAYPSVPANSATPPAPEKKTSEPAADKATEAPAAPSVPKSAELASAIADYKSHPDTTSFQAVWQRFRDLLGMPSAAHASGAAILAANPGLVELGARLSDAGGAKIWSFPKVQDWQSIIVQWQQPVGAATRTVVGRGRHQRVIITPAPTVSRIQVLSIPQNMVFRDARIIHGVGGAVAKTAKAPAPRPEGPRILALVGNERLSGTIWVAAYKQADGNWVENPASLASIPAYLIQNVAGRAYFAGNELVLALGSPTEPGGTQSSGYKVSLRLVDGKFAVEGKAFDQGPALAATQFMQALQQNHADAARACLVDPSLLSVPKYIGVFNRPADKPMKLIAMSAPLLSGARFRIMTYEKDDLIVDVTKVKNQWAIKAVFIAPPDPLAQKLMGVTVTPPVTADTKANLPAAR